MTDTAGIRDTVDPLEQLSIARTQDQAALAEVVIFVLDATREPSRDELTRLNSCQARPTVIAINKTDSARGLPPALAALPSAIAISAKTHAGLDALMAATLAQLDLVAINPVEPFAFTGRQRELLARISVAVYVSECDRWLSAM